jgi:hypothetical protein
VRIGSLGCKGLELPSVLTFARNSCAGEIVRQITQQAQGAQSAQGNKAQSRHIDANREQAETFSWRFAYSENETPETRRPALRAGRCPGKPGRISRLATLILPENMNRRKSLLEGQR